MWLTASAYGSPEGLGPLHLKPLEGETARACIDEYVVHRTIAPVSGQ